MQQNNSRTISTNQQGIHENLEAIVRKHFEKTYQKPIAQHTQAAFDAIKPTIETALNKHTPLHFDSFCGTGISTANLARNNPDALVIGIDRSITRLSKTYNLQLPDNARLIQAECADFWQLAVNAGWQLSYHSIFYPNPYPKAKHIKRRWHAHPAFPLLFTLGGDVELRTNWKIYAQEFYQAYCYAAAYLPENKYHSQGVEILPLDDKVSVTGMGDTIKDIAQNTIQDPFMTLFEKKYALNGQKLYRCQIVYEKTVS